MNDLVSLTIVALRSFKTELIFLWGIEQVLHELIDSINPCRPSVHRSQNLDIMGRNTISEGGT
ncbi:Uncharacterised protein [Streptococcus pneumoniae]|nr:Uncharacterised protein [Streptococcus pneumoniae]